MKNTKNLERNSSADRITCFLPLYYNPLFKANYKTLKCYVIEMYFMQIFNKISLQLQNNYTVKSGRRYPYR